MQRGGSSNNWELCQTLCQNSAGAWGAIRCVGVCTGVVLTMQSQQVIVFHLLCPASFGVHRWDFIRLYYAFFFMPNFSQHKSCCLLVYDLSLDKGGYYLRSQVAIKPMEAHTHTYSHTLQVHARLNQHGCSYLCSAQNNNVDKC